jgi:hypothetical protein
MEQQMISKLRVLGTRLALCAIAVSAAGAIATAPAQAKLVKYGEHLETEKEHSEFLAFANCPFTAASELDCSWAMSSYFEMWPSKKVKEAYEVEHGPA